MQQTQNTVMHNAYPSKHGLNDDLPVSWGEKIKILSDFAMQHGKKWAGGDLTQALLDKDIEDFYTAHKYIHDFNAETNEFAKVSMQAGADLAKSRMIELIEVYDQKIAEYYAEKERKRKHQAEIRKELQKLWTKQAGPMIEKLTNVLEEMQKKSRTVQNGTGQITKEFDELIVQLKARELFRELKL